MKRSEQIICLIWVVFATVVCLSSVKLKLGSVSNPGPGFLPFVTAALLGLVSAVHLGLMMVGSIPVAETGPSWREVNWIRALYVLIAIAIYAVCLKCVGYVVDTVFLIVVLLVVMKGMRWWSIIAYTGLTVGSSYLLFGVWLEVQFPAGLWR